MAKLLKYPFNKEVTDLLSKFRSIPDGAKVKEVFLWELIFNSTRALFKIRCESLYDESKLATQPELFIHIVPDKTNNTLSIIDSGIGMTKDDLLNGLCTIQDYLQKQHMETIDKCLKLDASGGGADVDLSWIYASCMGYRLSFFSAYMVADKVLITTKHNGHDQYVWESNGRDSFTIARDTSGDSLLRGTKVTLFLKEDQLEYLEEHRLKGLVETYPTMATRSYPISISADNNPATMKPILDDDKKDEVPFEILQQQFEGLRKTFVKILGHTVKRVVLSNRLFELASFLSADMTTLEINPRHPIIVKLRKQAEANPNDVEALFKIRCESLFDKSKLATQPELFIHIVPDKTNNTLSIIDSGVGMTKDDLLNRLCTIQDFLQKQHMGTIDKCLKLDATGGGADVDLSWIYADFLGHRLSFFSAYMVADKVLITTKHNGHQQYVWESNGRDSFTIARDTSGDSLLRGTKVTLSLKEDQLEYLEEHRLKGLVETYPTVATFPYPIYISVENNKKLILDDDKKEEVPFEILQQQFEGLRKIFVKILGHRVKNVVLSNRLFEVASFLSADMTTLEINPRHHIIEKLRKHAEANPNGDEVKALVIQQFAAGLGNIYLYRRKYESTTNL